MVIFHFATLPVNHDFANGLNNAPVAIHAPYDPAPKKAPREATDAAYWSGYSAAMEDADLAIAPFHMGLAERDAFTQGVKDALNQIDFEIEEARRQTEAMDEKELDLLLSTMALEYRGAGPGFQD